MLTNRIDNVLKENDYKDIFYRAAFYERVPLTEFLKVLTNDIYKLPVRSYSIDEFERYKNHSTLEKGQPNRSSCSNRYFRDNDIDATDDDLFINLISAKNIIDGHRMQRPGYYERMECTGHENEQNYIEIEKSKINTIKLMKSWPDIDRCLFFCHTSGAVTSKESTESEEIDPWEVVNYKGPEEIKVDARFDRPSQKEFWKIIDEARDRYRFKYGITDTRRPFYSRLAYYIGLDAGHFSEMRRKLDSGKKVRPVAVSHLCGFCVVLESTVKDAYDMFYDCKTTNSLSDLDLIGQALVLCLVKWYSEDKKDCDHEYKEEWEREERHIKNYNNFVEVAVKAWRIFHEELPRYAERNDLWIMAMENARKWVKKEMLSKDFRTSGATDWSGYIKYKTK